MPASQRFHHGEQGNQIYLGDREALPSLTLHYVQRAAVQGASLLPSIIFGGSSAPQILRSGLLGRTFNRDCSWHQGLAYKSRSLYRSKKFVKNGSNNSEKFTSSVKIIVMTSSRAGIKKTSPQVELERGNLEQVLYIGNILKDYLERKGGETLSILMTEYDYATDIAVKQEEAYAEGISIRLERGAYQKALETAKSLLQDNFSAEIVAKYTSLPLETIHEIQSSL